MRQLLREHVVLHITGDSRTAFHYKKARSLFVPPVRLSDDGRAVAYPSDEVEAIVNARIAGKSDEEVRTLVQSLVAARGQLA